MRAGLLAEGEFDDSEAALQHGLVEDFLLELKSRIVALLTFMVVN